MASTAAKAARGAEARNALEQVTGELAGLLDLEIPVKEKVRDLELTAIKEAEHQAELLRRVAGAVKTKLEAFEAERADLTAKLEALTPNEPEPASDGPEGEQPVDSPGSDSTSPDAEQAKVKAKKEAK